jgi:hypothetical protein
VDAAHLAALLEEGHQGRTTHQTEANDTSSRSHAICQILLRDRVTDKLQGKLSLVDLAGSERGSDTRSHNAQRRSESSDINTSLLSLKECIRALDRNNESGKTVHVPYRGSKLTLLLKDCFTSPKAMTTMVATVSPGAASADHSLNTLRYADRIKEKRSKAPRSPQRVVNSRPLSTSPRRPTSSISPRRPPSASPRRPVDTTNQQPRQRTGRSDGKGSAPTTSKARTGASKEQPTSGRQSGSPTRTTKARPDVKVVEPARSSIAASRSKEKEDYDLDSLLEDSHQKSQSADARTRALLGAVYNEHMR